MISAVVASRRGVTPNICLQHDYRNIIVNSSGVVTWEVISECRKLNWLILTKRAELIEDRLPSDWGLNYSNVWLGVTAGCRKSLRRARILQQIPAAIRFISAEPLLEELDLSPYLSSFHWVITGCERAKKGERRIMSLDWVRDVDQQCRTAGIPHFFKQYYVNEEGVPREDGRLDNRGVQEWPVSASAFAG